MNMKPYFEFAEDWKSRDNITVVQFDNGLMAAIIDRYCINPDCNCVAVGLEFRKIDENGKLKETLFSCHLDTQTWEISKIKRGKANVDYEFLIKEFSANLDQTFKEKFRTRLRKAKEYGKDEIVDWLDDVDLNDNRCFSYTQVYGENVDEYKEFLFEYRA